MREPDVPLDQLADDADELDWDVARDGRMREHATTPNAEPTTVPYAPEGD
jgi:hypothetical protein